MDQQRDPRIDPRPGDVLVGKYSTGFRCRRTVKAVTPAGNVFCTDYGGIESLVGPKEWLEWAKTATVAKTGE